MPSLEEIAQGQTTTQSVGASDATDEFVVDFSGDTKTGGKIDDGWYLSTLLDAEPGVTGDKSKNPGAAKVVFKFEIIEDGPFKGRQRSKHGVLKGDGSGITANVIGALGFSVDTDGKGAKFSRKAARGRNVMLQIRTQRNDQQYDEVGDVKPADFKPKAPRTR